MLIAALLADPPAVPVEDPGSHFELLVYVSVALGVSFLCSVWEAVLLSTPRSHVELMVQKGTRGGERFKRLRRNVERPISAILTLNTIAHTVGAAGAGAEATLIFGSAWFGVISAVLTLLILIVSEIIPKTLGTVYCRRLAGITGTSVTVLVNVLYPVVWMLELLTRAFKPGSAGPSVSRAELQAMAAISAEEGGIGSGEARTFENLLRLEEVKVREIMTPRTVLFMLPIDLTVGELLKAGDLPPFSRIPITSGDADDIEAYVLKQDVLERAANDEDDVTMGALRRPIEMVPLGASVASALEQLAGKRSHLLLVVDEYGGTAGIVTLEDIMETLLGREIMDESDRVADLQEMARRRQGLQMRWYESRQRLSPDPPADDDV